MLYYHIIGDNPSGLWPLEVNSGNTFTDVSGYDRDATSSTALDLVYPVTARGVKAVSIDGTKTLSFPHPNTFIKDNEIRPFTIELWLKSDSNSGTFTLGRGGLGVKLTGDALVFDLGGTNVITHYIQQREPLHVVAVYSKDTMTLWVDSVEIETIATSSIDFSGLTASSVTASVTAGRMVTIDTVALYDYNLDPAAIQRHYMVGIEYFDVISNGASQDAITFSFSDANLPVVKQELNQYGPILTNMTVNGDELVQQYSPELATYPVATYTHLLQFDNLVYGTAAQGRIDWEPVGDPSRITVESSPDGVSWAPVTNHGMTTNWSDLMDGNDYFLRVTFSADPDSPAGIRNLMITMFANAIKYASSDSNVYATVVDGDASVGYPVSTPGLFTSRSGLKLNAGSKGLRVDTHTDFGVIASVEMIVNPITSYGTILENGASRIWNDAGGLQFTGFSRVMLDGVELTSGDTVYSRKPGFKHLVAVFSSANDNINYIGARADGTAETNFQISYLALHRGSLTQAQADQLYKTYVGDVPVRITENGIPPITEHVYSNGEIYRMYSFDWSIVGGGG